MNKKAKINKNIVDKNNNFFRFLLLNKILNIKIINKAKIAFLSPDKIIAIIITINEMNNII